MDTSEDTDFTEFEETEFDPIPKIINTSEHHMALVFVLDTSGSMGGRPIKSLNEGLNRFKIEVCEDKQTRDILDVAIVAFNNKHRVVQEFCPVEYMETVDLKATGMTNMSPAITAALDMVDERSRLYKRTGTAPYKPWVMLISDGGPTDDITAAIAKIKKMEREDKVSFRSLGVGKYDPGTLHDLCGEKVLKLEGTDFTTFFHWVNKSMRSVSQSTPDRRAKPVPLGEHLTIDTLPNWGDNVSMDASLPVSPSVSPSSSPSTPVRAVSAPYGGVDISIDKLPDWD
jgi:uncharacterized protein YegL